MLMAGGLSAQQLSLAVSPTYGSYNMSELKDLQKEQSKTISDTLYTTPKAIYNFPSSWGIRVSAAYVKKRNKFSLRGGYNATGGRLHYSDYSGLIKIDKSLNATYGGVSYSFLIVNHSKFQVAMGIGVDLNFSTLAIDNTVEIYISHEKTTEVKRYESSQVFLSPELTVTYFPLKNIFIEGSASYINQVSTTDLTNASGVGTGPTTKSLHAVALNWSGTRICIGMGYCINRNK